MKIAVSLLNFRPGMIGGAETYLRQLIANLPACRGDDRITLVAFRDIADQVKTPGLELAVADKSDGQIIAARALEAFTPYRALFAERIFARLDSDVVLFPQQSIFPKRVAAPAVVTAHDVQHLFYPENFALFDRLFRRAIYPYSAGMARQIIAVSDFTRKTLVDRCGINAGKITTVPLGFTPTDTANVEPYADAGGPYLYYPAATQPHKGHDALIRAFAALKREGGFDYRLIFTGRQTELWKKLERQAAELGVSGDVTHQGFVSFDRVRSLYAGAAAVVFPTRFEGFGLPVIEAVGFGKKVITSRLEVFSEIGLPPRFQIDFDQPSELRAALAIPGGTALTHPPNTWAQTAAQTLDVLRGVGRGPKEMVR